jgi:Icc-related predicted phosphoesterase
MKLVCISDTHLDHDFKVPTGDVLIHAGDATNHGTEAEVERFAEWFHALPHPIKIFVPGNHDFLFMEERGLAREILSAPNLHILIDEEVRLGADESVRFYGTPWVPSYGDWAFMRNEETLSHIYDSIPKELSVLITHGPAWGTLDILARGDHVGSSALLRRLADLHNMDAQPKVHVFGHIHTCGGMVANHFDMLSVNAAIQPDWLSEDELHSPTVVEI